MSDENSDILDSAIIKATGNLTSGDGHIAVDFYKILSIGLGGYLDEISFYHKQIKLYDQDGIRKDHFYTALNISIKAFQAFIMRFQSLALEMSSKEKDPSRGFELAVIAGNCKVISERPPENFYQALQLAYFVQLVLQIESNGHSVSLGRMD